jgi:predicted hydrocarbon binding protein
MSKREIPIAAIQRNRAWIDGVTRSLSQCGNPEPAKQTMKEAGKNCAAQLLEKTIDHCGKSPASVEELVAAINKRRKDLFNATNFWTIQGNQARFKLDECGCELVQANLASPNKTFCQCSAGMFERLFEPFCKGAVNTEIVKAIGWGDDCCEFIVDFGASPD